MTVFADLHRGNKVRLYDGDALAAPVWLLLEDVRPCEAGRCCVAWAQAYGAHKPLPLHGLCGDEVALIPKPGSPVSSECPAVTGDAVAENGAGSTPRGEA